MENQVYHHPKADELNKLEEIKRQAKLENNREKFENANNQIKQIIKENQIQVPNNFKELPLETQKSIINIKINEAKVLNDTDAVAYYSSVLRDIDNKINSKSDIKSRQEEKINQEVNETEIKKENIQTEEKHEEKEKSEEEKKEPQVIKGEKTTLTAYENNIKIESDYLSIKTNSKNTSLNTNLYGLLISIALIDVNKKVDLNEDINNVLKNATTEEDFNDIYKFINDIKIGETGTTLAILLEPYVRNYQNNLDKNNTEITEEVQVQNKVSNKLDDISKKKELLDMNLDELQNTNLKNPDDLYQVSGRYKKLITAAESELNSLNDQDKQKLRLIIDEMQSKITSINRYAEEIENLSRNMKM